MKPPPSEAQSSRIKAKTETEAKQITEAPESPTTAGSESDDPEPEKDSQDHKNDKPTNQPVEAEETMTETSTKIDDKVKTTDAATAGLGCHGGFES